MNATAAATLTDYEITAAAMRALWTEHVVQAGTDWKGPVYANVPGELADAVAEAMTFFGALVDYRGPITDGTGRVAFFSQGYRAHGF